MHPHVYSCLLHKACALYKRSFIKNNFMQVTDLSGIYLKCLVLYSLSLQMYSCKKSQSTPSDDNVVKMLSKFKISFSMSCIRRSKFLNWFWSIWYRPWSKWLQCCLFCTPKLWTLALVHIWMGKSSSNRSVQLEVGLKFLNHSLRTYRRRERLCLDFSSTYIISCSISGAKGCL
jgi:hypothetical protein